MIFDQNLAFLDFSELGHFALVAIVLAVSFATECFANSFSQRLDIFWISLNNQRPAFGLNCVSDSDEKEHFFVRLHSSKESVCEVDIDAIAPVQ